MLCQKNRTKKEGSNGQSVLSLIFLIGGIVVLIGLSVAFMATSFVNSSYGFQAAQRAQMVASAGVYDAMMQLARNKSFSSSEYDVPVDSNSATVTITQTSGQATITSEATVSNRKRRIQAVVSIDPNSGQLVLLSWNQTQ